MNAYSDDARDKAHQADLNDRVEDDQARQEPAARERLPAQRPEKKIPFGFKLNLNLPAKKATATDKDSGQTGQ